MIATRYHRAASLAVAAFSLATLFAVSVAEAKVVHFRGTRAQVHAACKALGLEAFDSTAPGYMGSGSTTCVNEDKGTAVTCNDNGTCEGSVPRIIGRLDLSIILAWPDHALSEPAATGAGSLAGGGETPAGAPPAPDAPAPVDIPVIL